MLYEQFARPSGMVGKLAGLFMNKENERLNEWTLSFLSIERGDRVLEIGFGPGKALQKVVETENVFLYGTDPSEAMVETVLRKLHAKGKAKQVGVINGTARDLEAFSQPLDKVFSVNNLNLWEAPLETLVHLHSLLRKGGKIALTLCPHENGADDDTTVVIGGQLRALLVEAGFHEVQVHIKPTKPNDSVCAVGLA
ncbi:class I SAM-dependent methyltransferase [Halobacillus sp. H74]|uniref:class I SAM-dependent methyltransferase n=1 Tax=Halobacillus sp. H74 TaxID=3457436 RepID=UPI003FCE5BA4